MGRSKFPGKPPKAVTRKRIKVLGRPDTTAPNDSVTVAENIYYGLSLFHGDGEKEHPPFHGFSTNEAKLSVSYIKTQTLEVEHEKDTTRATGEDEKTATNSNEKETSCSDTENRKSKTFRGEASAKPATTSSEKIGKKIGSNRKASKTKKITKIPKTPVLKSVNNILDRHQRTRQLRNSTAKRLLQRAKTGQTKANAEAGKFGNARKFVLPIRSAHSSRVIKPNKRFIEESEGISRQENHGDVDGTKGTKKAKVAVSKAKVNDSEEAEEKDGKGRSKKTELDDNDTKSLALGSKNQSQSASGSKQQLPDDVCATAKDLPDSACFSESSRVKTRSGGKGTEVTGIADKEKVGEGEQSEWTGIKLSEGKVVLRKARLKLDNKSLGGTEGPFSVVNTQNSMGMSSSIKCGVCGAVRFYRFVKQTRKFGVQSCVSCRKFINKMIKRQACAKSSSSVPLALQCIQGDGLCLIAPVVRNQEWNMLRCALKTRCHACWLKMCLKFYNIPVSVKSGLNAMLPQVMRMDLPVGQDACDVQNSKLPGKMAWPAEDSLEKNLFKSAWNNMDLGQKLGCQETTGGFTSRKFDKHDHFISISPNKKRKKDNRIKVRKKMKNPTTASTSPNLNEQALRQKVELKGPRVKHVCRSASVALGQPLATFPVVDGKDDAEILSVAKNISKAQDKDEDKASKKEETAKDKDQKTGQENSSCNIIVNSQPPTKRGKAQPNTSSNLLVTRTSAKSSPKPVHTISIDFWEQYDPVEVGSKGFALIASEPFHIPAICYLCGSAGKEPMIHCQCCCEPYHQFCLEPSEWNACSQPNWSCPRCTICQSCHIRSGPKLSCIRCRQSFHHSCLSKSGVSARLYSPDRPYVCQSCIKCKSCGSEGVSVHVGNLPLCSMCFKLRQRGNYCPLCQRCYNENDYDTKMMECNECSCWVHARCEGLSDERYQILSYLPDSIEFTCRQCTTSPNSIWRSAIEAELKAGFIAVIKALSKNRKACNALQWSPRKECLCRPLASVRRLDFSLEKVEKDTCEAEPGQSQDKELKSDDSSSTSTKMEVDGTRRVLRRLRYKFHGPKDLKSKNSVNRDTSDQESELSKDCNCSDQQVIARPSPTLMSVKRKVNGNEYGSLFQFYCDMEHVISRTEVLDLMETYRRTLREVFPWFDVKESPSGQDLDALSTPVKESQNNCLSSPTSLDDSILDVWRDEILKAPKAIAAKTANLYSGNVHMEDSRSCCLCKGLGDGLETREGRLLYCGQNEWVHANCVLWSNEVFEEIDGSLQNVHSAISRGRMIRCTECGKKGASVGCCSRSCGSVFHFPCARNVGLTFNEDKTIFCVSHSTDNVRKVEGETDFYLKRPVYVELDRKKKKFAEPNTVRVMVGSLTIDRLGSVIPEFSDCVENIVPVGYKCSRLYWSTVNPSKIVRYYVRTFVQVCVPEVTLEVENNVTIDHSMEHKVAENAELAVVKQLLDAIVDSVCNKEVDENLAEQNNQDLLPPELKEAIFEDLPHDLLDGISMQDIFPKASYEDFLAMDLKDDILPDNKTIENDLQDLVDDLFNSKSHKICSARELKRPKSEVVASNVIKGQQPRSCSLTWSCKLDATTMKRRKITRSKTSDDGLFHEIRILPQDHKDHKKLVWHARQQPRPILQVDGAADPGSSSSECGSPEYNTEERANFPVANTPLIFKFDRASENKFCTIPQLDGAGDASSDEEYDNNNLFENHPVTCVRCQCTYRTQDSYDRHLYNCEMITTSDSDSDVTDNKFASSPETAHFDSNCFVVRGSSPYNRADVQQVISPLEASVPSPHLGLQIEPMGQAIITPQIHAHSTVETLHRTVLTTNDVIVQTQYTRTTTMLPQENGLQIADSQETPMLPGEESSVENLYSQEMISRDQDTVFHSSPKPVRLFKPSKTPKVKPKLAKTVSRNAVPQVSCGVRYQQQGNPMIQLQQPRSQAPTLILEQVATPAPNIVSSYVESLQQQQQQQSGQQSVQYITAIGNQEAYKPQYIATNPLVPGAYIQASSENLLALQTGGLALQNPQILQIAQPQQTVLGTVLGIQQQPTAIQCGVISSEQLVLSSAPTLEMFTDSTGSMFVSSQPMYYGLETIVSNTVMSSSQFMSGPVPQVLASSYQTTTQVFQASKLMEPLVDVQPIPNVQAVPGIQNIPTVSTLSNVPTVSQNVAQPVQGLTGNFVLLNQSTRIASEQLPGAHHQLGIPQGTLDQNFIHAARNPVIPVPTQQPIVEPAKLVQNQEIPNVINYVNPTLQMSCPSKPLQQGEVPAIPRVAVRPSPVVQQEPECRTWRYIEPPPEPKYQDSSLYLDSKRVSENTSMIKSSLPSRIPPLPNHCIAQRSVDKVGYENMNVTSRVATSTSNTRLSSSPVNAPCPGVPSNKVTMPINSTPTSRPMNRVLPMQVTPKQEPVRMPTIVEKVRIMEEPGKLEKPLVLEDRVEKMQEEKCLEDDGMVEEKIKSIIELSGKWRAQKEKVELKQDLQEKNNQETPLKIVLQKQFKDGSYKIAQSRASEKKENPISQTPATIVHTTTLPLLPIKKFELKTSKTTSAPKISSPPPLRNPTPPVTFSKASSPAPTIPKSPSPIVSSSNPTCPLPKPSSPAPTAFSKSNVVFSKPLTPPAISKVVTPVSQAVTTRPPMKNVCYAKVKSPPIAVKKPRLLPKSTPVVQRAQQQQQQPKKLSKPSLMYEIKSQDGFVHTASSMEQVWEMVFQEVQNARKSHNMPLLPYNPLSGNIGLENNATIYLIEQLPNVNKCTKYTPKFHTLKPPKLGEGEEFMRESEKGAARAEPFKGRRMHDMFSWLASRHRKQPKMSHMSEMETRRLSSTNLPMAMRFRNLKEISKESVGVYHSHIHGRGLFCLRDIEAGEMVVEYAGEVIRSSLTDKREKYYDSKNIGCYMFKIDDHLVIDATMKGNAARFINHSCDPNCYSRVVDILGMKHILIFALRRIIQGEELTYDYKFPFEDIKIPCTCGSRRCRKYLN